jgi:hypothetical protein
MVNFYQGQYFSLQWIQKGSHTHIHTHIQTHPHTIKELKKIQGWRFPDGRWLTDPGTLTCKISNKQILQIFMAARIR